MPEQTSETASIKLPMLERLKNFWADCWTGERRIKNLVTLLGLPAIVAVLAPLASWFHNLPEAPDDLEHATFLKNNFEVAIQTAIDEPNHGHYFLPANLTRAGQLLEQHIANQSGIQIEYVSGNKESEIAFRDVENGYLLAQAQEVFRHGIDGSISGEIVVGGIKCDTTNVDNAYNCRFVTAEVGGFVDPHGSLEACERITDNFTVMANMDGSIEYLRTKGPGYSSTIDFDTSDKPLEEVLTDGLVAHVVNNITYFGAQAHPQETAAFIKFSACPKIRAQAQQNFN
jgi:hypothetical protein